MHSLSFLGLFLGLCLHLSLLCLSTWIVKMKSLNHVQLFTTLWTIAYQVPPSIGFSRQEYWSGLPFPSPGNLPNPGIEPRSPTLQADALTSEPPGKPLDIQYKLLSISLTKSHLLPYTVAFTCSK